MGSTRAQAKVTLVIDPDGSPERLLLVVSLDVWSRMALRDVKVRRLSWIVRLQTETLKKIPDTGSMIQRMVLRRSLRMKLDHVKARSAMKNLFNVVGLLIDRRP